MKKLVLAIFIASSLNASSQVYTAGTHFNNHHDIFPDTLLNWQYHPFTMESYSLDIFGTTAPDIRFTALGAASPGGSAGYVSVTSLNPDVDILFGRFDSVWVPANSNWYVTRVAKPLLSGDPINAPGAVWKHDTLYLVDVSGSGGGNKNVTDFVGGDKYVGLKYDVLTDYGTDHYYGWIWVQCTTIDSCYIKEYSGMLKTTGLADHTMGEAQLFPNPTSGLIYLREVNTGFNLRALKIEDVLGKQVGFTAGMHHQDVEIRFEETVPAGIYILSYPSEGKLICKKIIKR